MHGNSKPVASGQTAPHRDLERLLARHVAHRYCKPIAPYSRAAFDRFQRVHSAQLPIVLDAGCGNGESTFALAALHPGHLVVGVDQSAARLARGLALPGRPDNALLLRADIVDIWRLLAATGVTLAAHYLLYPNPWPKPAQLMRRWPAHPVFPAVVALGGRLECRSNWRVYAEEFALAVGFLSGSTIAVDAFHPECPLTPFERKYHASGHALYRVVQDLPAHQVSPGPAVS